MVTIVLTYVAGTERVLRTCLAALDRHDAGHPYRIHIYGDIEAAKEALRVKGNRDDIDIVPVSLPDWMKGSDCHIAILDEAMQTENGLILTLDSDCFPVADGWLAELVEWYGQGHLLPGILWPWEPPSPDVKEKTMDWKVRNYHNWNNSWVACQLVHTDFIREFCLSYGGDVEDTGFALIDKVSELGRTIKGWMPTRCAKARRASAFDNEFNRLLCVVYGDKMFHIGGATQQTVGHNLDPLGLFAEAVDRTLRHRGAEWILEDGNSHEYRFDREDEVVEFKMNRIYAEMKEHLKTHDRAFRT